MNDANKFKSDACTTFKQRHKKIMMTYVYNNSTQPHSTLSYPIPQCTRSSAGAVLEARYWSDRPSCAPPSTTWAARCIVCWM